MSLIADVKCSIVANVITALTPYIYVNFTGFIKFLKRGNLPFLLAFGEMADGTLH